LKREFLINLILLVLINLLIKPFFIFGIDLAVQNRTGSDYGLYFALFNVTFLFQIIGDFGVQNFNNRHVSQHPQLLGKYFPNLLALKLLLSFAYLVVSLFFAWFLMGYEGRALPLLFILLCNQALVQLLLFLRSNISGMGHYRLDSFLSALDKLLMIVTCGLLLWVIAPAGNLKIEHFALAQTAALALAVLVVFVLLRRLHPVPLKPSWVGNWRSGRASMLLLLRESIPYALVLLLMTAYTRLDAVLLERLLPDGAAHADVYAGAYRLLDAANMFGFLFATLLLPMFARMLRQDRSGTSVRPLVSLGFKLIWAGSITLASAVFLARQDLVELMMPLRASAYRWDTLGILIWTFVPVSVTYIFSTLLTASGRLMAMNRFFALGLLLGVTLNLTLIPLWQAVGSAWATLLTQSFIAAAMIFLCFRFFPLKPSWKGLLQVAAFAVLVPAAQMLIYSGLDVAWYWRFVLALFCGLAGLLVLRLVDWRGVKALTPDHAKSPMT